MKPPSAAMIDLAEHLAKDGDLTPDEALTQAELCTSFFRELILAEIEIQERSIAEPQEIRRAS